MLGDGKVIGGDGGDGVGGDWGDGSKIGGGEGDVLDPSRVKIGEGREKKEKMKIDEGR